MGAAASVPSRLRFLGSVRARVTLIALAVVGVALLASAISLIVLVQDSLVDNLDEAAEVLADDVKARLRSGSLSDVIPVPKGEDDDDLVIQILDARRRVVATSENYRLSEPITAEEPVRGRLHTTVSGLAVDPDERFRILGERAVTASGEPVTIYVATELEPVRETVSDVRRAVTVGAPLLLASVGLLVWLLVGRTLRSVEAIRREVARISESGLDRRVPEPPIDDEVARLARTMNAMLARLQSSVERQQRFLSDASHELRSPLASTRTGLEVALAHPEMAALEAAATDALGQTARLERLVTDLLFLARDDESRLVASAGLVDVDDIVRTEAARVRARGRVTVDTSRVATGRVWGVPGDLERAVRNLLDNAERHGRTRVSVSLSSEGPTLVLAVGDDGAGVAPEDRERIFDRFVRVDDHRSRQSGGTGLGLAITREVIVAHGGAISVEDDFGGGARFVARLPSASGEPGRGGPG
jgi:signal transduction histidine kinase